eukprot:CAMPEP_0114457472 /NCGR_PEP_ID=MMETSP0104-20121206/4180_1 /TAXON_ID=37642 ORGANISM="Paraphysomonas imperforata, Strain PA2" /NCGR_SAMPLE_ID=MMETSP0104 /ASSEMBLY_ACC=CAM_ASM_000202 /LENGTH=1284 /DNA_ID=CAMNT_0001630019 /DNA_START=112 /DNA_END=3966 /DNA_ORIENTATION=+
MNNMFLGSKILTSMNAYRREKEEFKMNWPRSHSILRKKDFEDAKNIIYPQQKLKIIWDFFVGALIMESVIVVPLRLGFHIVSRGASAHFDIFIDICFGIDMLLTFFTAYEVDSIMIVDHKKICKNYLKSWFTIDFMSTFPFDVVIPYLLEGISPGALRSIKLVRALRLFRLLKLFRVARLNRKIKDAKIEESIHPVVYDLLGLFFWIFIMSHILCCGFYFFSGCDDDDGIGVSGDDWQQCGKADLTSKYILSMYWTIATILSVGYGDVFLTSNSGRIFAIFVIFLGSIIFGILVSTVQSSAKNWNKQETARMTKLNQVREYIYEKKVLGALRRQMSNHFEYYHSHKANMSEEAIVLEMPIILRQYALEHTKKQLMGMSLLKSMTLDIIMDIIPHLHPFLAQKGEFIHREGEICMDLFLLVNGTVEAFKKDHDSGVRSNYLVGIYETGSEFGLERAIAVENVTWSSSRACDKCDLMWMSNASIHQVMAKNDEIKGFFDEEARRETVLMKVVDDNIATQVKQSARDSKKGSRSEGMSRVQGAFKIPKCVIHNNIAIINVRAVNRILQNVESHDGSEVVVTTFKTVRVKMMDGEETYIYQQETTRQMWKRWIINPHCQNKVLFDLVIMVMVVTSSLTVPYRMGFDITNSPTWSAVDGVTEVFFCFDLILAFFTAYEYKDSSLDTSLKNIAWRYIRSWFLIDLVSAVPFYRITAGESSLGIVARLLKTLKLGRLFRLFKVFKFARILKLLEISNMDFMPNEFIAIQNSFGMMFKLLLFLGFTTHIIACIFSWISIDNSGQTWASDIPGIRNTFERYIAALYWTYATMATVGYGDIHARNDSERVFSIIIMVLGSTGLAYIISELSDHVFNKGSGKGQQDYKISISRDYFMQNSSPQSWRDSMIKHFSFLMEKRTAFDDRLIWSQMPHSLRTELIRHVSHEDFSKIALFKTIKSSVLCALYKYAEYCMLSADSFMYTFETGSAGLYFVLKGYAEVVDEKAASKITEGADPTIVIASIQEGMFFGHESIMQTTFDYLGIRAKSDMLTLFFPSESIARMKKEVPVIYETLVYIIDEAVKISFGTYDVGKNVGVLKRNISKIMKMKKFIKKTENSLSTRNKFVKSLRTSISRFYRWITSDVDEAKSLYQLFSRKDSIAEIKAKKKEIEDSKRLVLSDGSYERFRAIKEQKEELDFSLSPARSNRISSRRMYASLYNVDPEDKRRHSQSMSRSASLIEQLKRGRESGASSGVFDEEGSDYDFGDDVDFEEEEDDIGSESGSKDFHDFSSNEPI